MLAAGAGRHAMQEAGAAAIELNIYYLPGHPVTSYVTELPRAPGQRFRVIDVVPFDDEDESPFVGLLQVEPA